MNLNFFLSEQDQARIDPGSIVVEDIDGTISATLPQLIHDTATLQSLLVKFRVTDPNNGAPQIKLLFSGHLNYIPDSHDAGVIPNIDDVDEGLSNFDTWNNHGIIRVQADAASVDHLETLNAAFMPFGKESPVMPNQVWYYPICITREFILSFLSATNKVVLTESGDTVILPPGHLSSTPIRLVEFFRSGFAQWIRTAASPSITPMQSMPTVKMDANGNVTLVVSMARQQEPQDRKDNFDHYNPDVSRLLPRHVANGPIPPRYILRKFKSALQEVASNNGLAAKVLEDPPQAVDYIPIQYTRTAIRSLNCSVYFPGQQVQINDSGGIPLWIQRLPSHGVVFLPIAPNQTISTINCAISTFESELVMHHLKGADDSWRQSPDPNPLTFDLANEPRPHVVLRLPMRAAVLPELLHEREIERAISENHLLSSCSYMSMRRTVRALIDNRIAGGRYNFEGRSTVFRNELVEKILPINLAQKIRNDLPSKKFTGTEQQQTDQIRARANILRRVLEFMFSDPAPEYPGGNPSANGTYPIGRVAYFLWQSIISEFSKTSTKKFYSNDLIGRGAPGALVALGLAEFVLEPTPDAGETYTTPAFLARIVNTMMTNSQAGMLLQFWKTGAAFVMVKDRKQPTAYGHSPMYLLPARLDDDFEGFYVIDHNGSASVRREADSQLLNWTTISNNVEHIWISAKWLE